MNPLEKDLATIYQLLCSAMAHWTPPDESHPAWPREAAEKERIYVEMRSVFERYPGVLYAAARAADPIEARWPLMTDDERMELLGRLECCRGCGSLDTRCHCQNDE